MPMLSTCAVARKSALGENATLMAALGARNTSRRRPLGTSNVRTPPSSALATSQRASDENACGARASTAAHGAGGAHNVDDAPAEPAELAHNAVRLDVDDAHGQVVAHNREQPAAAVERERDGV
jgi:hypothetical protein